jgi:hypothetical protein
MRFFRYPSSLLRLAMPEVAPKEIGSVLAPILEEESQRKCPIEQLTSLALEDSFATLSNLLVALSNALLAKGGHALEITLLKTGAFRFRLDCSFLLAGDSPSPLELFEGESPKVRGCLYYLVSEMTLSLDAQIQNDEEIYHYRKGRLIEVKNGKADSLNPFTFLLEPLYNDFRDVLDRKDVNTILRNLTGRYGE